MPGRGRPLPQDPNANGSIGQPSSDVQAYGLLAMTTLFWGCNAVVSRIAVGEISPMVMTTLRWVFCIILVGLVSWRAIRANMPIMLRHWRSLTAMGALGFTGFNALFYLAGHYTQALNLSIIQGSIPVLVLIGARIFYATPIRLIQVLGMAATFLGVAIVASKGDLATLAALDVNFGDLLMLVACGIYAGYTLALRRRPAVPATALFGAMSTVALVTALPLLLWEAAAGAIVGPTPFGWLLLAFVVVFPSILAQIYYMRSVEIIGPPRAGLFVNLVPVFGSCLAVAVLGEDFGVHHALGLVLVVGGILLAESRTIRGLLKPV